jgi:hypothetical protein
MHVNRIVFYVINTFNVNLMKFDFNVGYACKDALLVNILLSSQQ